MKHYITPDNKLFGFDDTQTHLIPSNAKLIPDSYAMDQIPFLEIVNDQIVFNQTAYDDIRTMREQKINARNSAIAKLTALGLSEDEISSLGV